MCRKLGMTFRQYMGVKDAVLREAVKLGMVDREELAKGLRVKRDVAEAVFDFLVEQEGLPERKVESMVPEQE